MNAAVLPDPPAFRFGLITRQDLVRYAVPRATSIRCIMMMRSQGVPGYRRDGAWHVLGRTAWFVSRCLGGGSPRASFQASIQVSGVAGRHATGDRVGGSLLPGGWRQGGGIGAEARSAGWFRGGDSNG